MNKKSVSLTNRDYIHIINKPVSLGVLSLQKTYGLSDNERQEIVSIFNKHVMSIKPWIPYQQFIQELVRCNYKVYLRPHIEDEYIRQLQQLIKVPLIPQHEVFSGTDLVLTSFNDENSITVKARNIDNISEFQIENLRSAEFRNILGEQGIHGDYNFKESNKYWDFSKEDVVSDLPEYLQWHEHIPLKDIQISGPIVRGFKRGSRQLGCPTANIEMNEINRKITENLVPGVYSAIGQFIDPIIDNLKQQSERKYMCALSIGWNPVYDNAEKTVEVYIIHDFGDNEFYGENFNIHLKSFMRPEALFPTFDDLILAIHCDVEAAKVYLSKLI